MLYRNVGELLFITYILFLSLQVMISHLARHFKWTIWLKYLPYEPSKTILKLKKNTMKKISTPKTFFKKLKLKNTRSI